MKNLILICLMLTSWRMFALDFETSNYYTKNYLFDAQIYSVNTFVSENTLSHQVGNFIPHLDYVQYQGLDQYKESDFGFGSEYKLTDKLTLDAGSWYYYYYSAGDHYFEPYTSLSYDWIVSPTIYFSMITYNNTPRAVLSFDYNKGITEKLHFNFRPVLGTADYDDRYGYYGLVINLDYNVNKYFTLFTSGEIDKPFNSLDNGVVYTYSLGLRILL